MTKKVILEVEVNTSAWDRFNASVKAQQILLSKMPGQWGAVGGAIGKASDKVAKMVANAKNLQNSFAQAKTVTDKFVIGLQTADRTITALVRGSFSLAKNIASVTTSIAKWGAGIAISGILSLGGLFATFGSMGKGIAETRSNAMQSGSTYGQQKAGTDIYGVYGIPATDLMKMITNDIHSGGVAMSAAFNGDRTKFEGKEGGDVLPLYLQSMHDMYNKFNATNPATVNQAMAAYFPDRDPNMMRQVGKENISDLNKRYITQSPIENMKQGTQDRYTKFASDMDLVWDNAKKKLADAFMPLLDPLTKLSNSLIKSLGTVLGDKHVQGAIAKVGEGIASGAKWLATPEGQQAIADGIANVAKFAKAVYDVAVYLEDLLPKKGQPQSKTSMVSGGVWAGITAVTDRIGDGLNIIAGGVSNVAKSAGKDIDIASADYQRRNPMPAKFNQQPIVIQNNVTVHSDSIPGALAAQAAF